MSIIHKFNKNIPRYTSYPPAPFWNEISPSLYAEKLTTLPDIPLSLYFHIPFCQSMCLFCGCSVILNRNPDKEKHYVHLLLKELELVTSHFKKKKKVSQIHFGGGTPTKLSHDLLGSIFNKTHDLFEIDLSGEIAIEIDPRTINYEKLLFLKNLGFNRVSFGVQDTNQKVQEAVKRRQSKEMTCNAFHLAKNIGFQEINIDLIYGLPFQTEETFAETVQCILSLKPDRIALFSYAKVPWLKPHQKAIPDSALPSLETKFAIYTSARKTFIEAGYLAIGMDHFALKTSALAKCYENKTLKRNFQGYTHLPTSALIGFGVSSIGFLQDAYIQNFKDLSSYESALLQESLPLFRGKELSQEDILRNWVIQKVMCTFEVDKNEFFEHFGISFDTYFQNIEFDELVENGAEKLTLTPLGELFVRNVASLFDAYLKKESIQFSQSI